MPLPIDNKKDVAVGITLPLRNSDKGFFNKSYTTLEQAKTNLKNLLLTQKGERPFQPQLGTDIYRILFEPITEELPDRIAETIEDSVQKWLPYLTIVKLKVSEDDDTWAKDIDAVLIRVHIEFALKNDPTFTNAITFRFNAGLGAGTTTEIGGAGGSVGGTGGGY